MVVKDPITLVADIRAALPNNNQQLIDAIHVRETGDVDTVESITQPHNQPAQVQGAQANHALLTMGLHNDNPTAGWQGMNLPNLESLMGGDLGMISLDAAPDNASQPRFHWGSGITIQQARSNTLAFRALLRRAVTEQRGKNLGTSDESGVYRAFFTAGRGALFFDAPIQNVLYLAEGTPETSSEYGQLTYDIAAGTITRTSGSWLTAGYAQYGAIDIYDETAGALDNNGQWMIQAVDATTITIRQGKNVLPQFRFAGSTTTATVMPQSQGQRIAMAIRSTRRSGLILGRVNKGNMLQVWGAGSNPYTTGFTLAPPLTDDQVQPDSSVTIDEVQLYTPSGHCMTVESGNKANMVHIGVLHMKTDDANYSAFYGQDMFAGFARMLQVQETAGDALTFEDCNALQMNVRIETTGKAGIRFTGVTGCIGNVFTGLVELTKSYALAWHEPTTDPTSVGAGYGNTWIGHVERSNYQSTTTRTGPEFYVRGHGNTIIGKITSGLNHKDATIEYGDQDARDTTRLLGSYNDLPQPINIIERCREYAQNLDHQKAFWSIKDVSRGPRSLTKGGNASVVGANPTNVQVTIDAAARTLLLGSGDWTNVSTVGVAPGQYVHLNNCFNESEVLVDSLSQTTDPNDTATINSRHRLLSNEVTQATVIPSDFFEVADCTFDRQAGTITRAAGSWLTTPGKVVDGVSSPGLVANGYIRIRGNNTKNAGIWRLTSVTASVATVDAIELSGTASGGSTTTLVIPAASNPRTEINHYRDKFVVTQTGTGAGQNRQILSSQATAAGDVTLTVDSWTAVDATTTYEVHAQLLTDEGPIAIDAAAVPATGCCWFDNDKMRFLIRAGQMDGTFLTYKIFDLLASNTYRSNFIGMQFQAGDQLYWKGRVSTAQWDYYARRLPRDTGERYTIQLQIGGLNALTGAMFCLGPGIQEHAARWPLVEDWEAVINNAYIFTSYNDGDAGANPDIVVTLHDLELGVARQSLRN